MSDQRQSSLRLLAPITLAVFALLVVIVIAVSLGGSSDSSGVDQSTKQEQAAKKPKRRFYTIKNGDNLNVISEKTGVPIADLEALNPTLDPQALIAGQRVKLR